MTLSSSQLSAVVSPSSAHSERVWSSAQSNIFVDVATGEGHMTVQARAGTGKTTTIVEALKHVPAGLSVLMVAFNKIIATELASRVGSSAEVMTLHALGFRAIRARFDSKAGRTQIDADKMRNIVRKLAAVHSAAYTRSKSKTADSKRVMELVTSYDFQTSICKIASLCKGYLTADDAGIENVIDVHQITPPEHAADFGIVISFVKQALAAAMPVVVRDTKTGKIGPKASQTIDFDDMIWWPVALDLALVQYDRVFIDETQDLNACQVELALRSCKPAPHGRICAVGDDKQAIYGFRGAASDAFGALVKRLEARVLPLNVTYRCAKAIVAIANRVVPDLQAAPNAAEGIFRSMNMPALVNSEGVMGAQAGDFILSRTNAPLVGLCIAFIKDGRKANIQGRDVGVKLSAVVKRAQKAGVKTVSELQGWLDGWCAEECIRLEAKQKDTQVVIDTKECILAICDDPTTDMANLLRRIDMLFADTDMKDIICLSSTHKAKGLERDRVFMLAETYLKVKKGESGPSNEERNLFYVAVTRAKTELVFVYGELQK